MERALARVQAIVRGNPLDKKTMIGAQASTEQMEKILSYFDIGHKEGATVLAGGERNQCAGYAGQRLLRQAAAYEKNRGAAACVRRAADTARWDSANRESTAWLLAEMTAMHTRDTRLRVRLSPADRTW